MVPMHEAINGTCPKKSFVDFKALTEIKSIYFKPPPLSFFPFFAANDCQSIAFAKRIPPIDFPI
jgi:hypothetical protein